MIIAYNFILQLLLVLNMTVLLLIVDDIKYGNIASSVKVIINILFDGEDISFGGSLVMYINSTSIPPTVIINIYIYENQTLLYIIPLIRHIIVVCVRYIIRMAGGCFICINVNILILFSTHRNLSS